MFKKITIVLLVSLLFAGMITVTQESGRALGIAESDLSAFSYPMGGDSCAIIDGEFVLALAQTEDGDLLIFAGSEECDGMVWLQADDVAAISWEDDEAVADLPVIDAPQAPRAQQPLSTLSNYNNLCENAESMGYGTLENDPPYLVFARRMAIDEAYLATSTDELDLVVCTEREEMVKSNCPYRTTSGQDIYVQRIRVDTVVRLVSYESGQIINSFTFAGGRPQRCPNFTSTSAFRGAPPDTSVLIEWIETKVSGAGEVNIPRTTINVGMMNARAESNTRSEIVTEIPYGTPLNLIARNEAGDWVVALTPEMQQVWLFVSLLSLATHADIDSLPLVDDPASDVEIALPEW